MVKIIKHNGNCEAFNGEKIRTAIRKAACRVCIDIPEKDENRLISSIRNKVKTQVVDISVNTIHNMVETELDNINQPRVAKSYREYRDSKSIFSAMLDKVYSKKLSLAFVGDRSNANSDSALVTTQKAIVYNELNSELYKKFFLTQKEERAMSDGYIYVHDRGSRLDTMNCCVYDMESLLKGGFFMGNLDYVEPKSLAVAFDLIGDVTLNAASSQYGGFTIPQVDKLFAPYAEKSYKMYYDEYVSMTRDVCGKDGKPAPLQECTGLLKRADEYATAKVRREFEQGFQSWEMKFNSVASSRGDYPFTAITFGLGTGKFETMCSSICLKVRKGGQGKPGLKHPVLFPKLSFFYDENIHGEGKELEWLFDEAIECSMKTMYPDFISLTGDGYTSETYKKYGVATSKMGCIDYGEKILVKGKGQSPVHDLTIGEFFNRMLNYKTNVSSYPTTKVNATCKYIKDPIDKEKYRKYGYIMHDGELMNQWAIDFCKSNGRRPSRGDVHDFFGYVLPRKIVRTARGIDASLFNLWDSYLELKVSDILVKNGYKEVDSEENCTSSNQFVRNKVWKLTKDKHSSVFQIDIYFPKLKLGFEVEDFATHSRVDDEPYIVNEMPNGKRIFKKGPTYFKTKQDFFKTKGIKVFEIWEDEIRASNFSILEKKLKTKLDCQAKIEKKHKVISEVHTKEVDYVDLVSKGIFQYVQDIDGSFTRIKAIIRNKFETDWRKISLSNGQSILVTSDHPLLTPNGQTMAIDLAVGNQLIDDEDELIDITSIDVIEREAHSYDLETESHTFIFSGIQSHNCRAAVSRWFERGGVEPADENDKCIMDGRFNMGAISLHFSMIGAKAKKEDKDYFDVLDYYLEMVRNIHKRTIEFLSHKKAGINPLGFCQGGFYGGHLDPDQELGMDFLKPMTISFGIIGLNEASVLMTGKTIHEDNSWAIDVLKHINEYVDRIKKEDGILYAIYGTPGESLVATQAQQFKKKYGIIKGVSDHDYVTNSFHCPVYADITPIQKQDIEYPMFHLVNGGQIAYARMRSNYNFKAFKDLTRRAMKLGFYWGNNQQLDWCEDCGHAFIDSDVCPKCGSEHLTRVERMNGYISYASVRGKTMYSDTKLQEFKERVSM